ncbi:MAG: helix-turn-helix transcriptional regulator [Lachnospiraceae bacterium]|nr:helix-turn-helix transcriptional regulator [Lachnospiraceae bacterium]
MKVKQDRIRYNVGSNIRKYRNKNNLTQNQTVTKMQLLGVDISRSSYSQLECGLYNIRVEVLLALSEIFHVEINAFFEGMTL